MTMKRILATLCLLPGLAAAATLKPFTSLNGETVRLSDLFEGADDRPLGPGPAPGARIIVETPQLTAIAHMFGVDWRSSGPGDRAILERAGKTLAKEDILPSLRATLQASGAPADSDIQLPSPSIAPLPANVIPALDYTGVEFDPGSGRFTVLLHIGGPGVSAKEVRLSGLVQAMIELPVPRRAMMTGEVLTAADLQWTRLRIGLAHGDIVRLGAQAEGQALRRPLQAGMPILLADLGRPITVIKGQPLVLSLDGPGLTLTAQGVANEPGGIGDRIHVTNSYSRAVLQADITGPAQARVVPGSVPINTSQLAAR